MNKEINRNKVEKFVQICLSDLTNMFIGTKEHSSHNLKVLAFRSILKARNFGINKAPKIERETMVYVLRDDNLIRIYEVSNVRFSINFRYAKFAYKQIDKETVSEINDICSEILYEFIRSKVSDKMNPYDSVREQFKEDIAFKFNQSVKVSYIISKIREYPDVYFTNELIREEKIFPVKTYEDLLSGKYEIDFRLEADSQAKLSKAFDFVYVDIAMVKAGRSLNEQAELIKKFHKELIRYMVSILKEDSQFKRYGVPVNCLKISSLKLTKDFVLRFILELKGSLSMGPVFITDIEK